MPHFSETSNKNLTQTERQRSTHQVTTTIKKLQENEGTSKSVTTTIKKIQENEGTSRYFHSGVEATFDSIPSTSASKDLKARKKKTKLTPVESARFAETTNFSEPEVIRLHKKFISLSKGETELSYEAFIQIEEMHANPFAIRICELFSEDGSGCLTFQKFLNMMDAFHDDTPSEVKMIWAFAIWDFDGDGMIGREDIKHGIDLVTCSGPISQPTVRMMQRVGSSAALDDDEIDQIVMHVFQEVDPNCNGLTYFDFRSILTRMPDFLHNFHISL